jgi:hypothetical protein
MRVIARDPKLSARQDSAKLRLKRLQELTGLLLPTKIKPAHILKSSSK